MLITSQKNALSKFTPTKIYFRDELDQVRALLLDDSKNEVLGFRKSQLIAMFIVSILTDEEADKMLEDMEQD